MAKKLNIDRILEKIAKEKGIGIEEARDAEVKRLFWDECKSHPVACLFRRIARAMDTSYSLHVANTLYSQMPRQRGRVFPGAYLDGGNYLVKTLRDHKEGEPEIIFRDEHKIRALVYANDTESVSYGMHGEITSWHKYEGSEIKKVGDVLARVKFLHDGIEEYLEA